MNRKVSFVKSRAEQPCVCHCSWWINRLWQYFIGSLERTFVYQGQKKNLLWLHDSLCMMKQQETHLSGSLSTYFPLDAFVERLLFTCSCMKIRSSSLSALVVFSKLFSLLFLSVAVLFFFLNRFSHSLANKDLKIEIFLSLDRSRDRN